MMMIVRLARTQSTLTRQLGSRRSVSTGISSRKADEIKRGGWKGTAVDGNESKCYIGGGWVQVGEKATKWWDVADPTTQNVLSRVPQPNHALLVQAVDEAEKAFESWSKTSLLHRQGIMLRYQSLIRKHWDDLANSIVLEQGKTFADAKGDVLRGLQVVDSMCALPNLMLGDKLEVSQGMDTYIRKSPLGIGAAICPG